MFHLRVDEQLIRGPSIRAGAPPLEISTDFIPFQRHVDNFAFIGVATCFLIENLPNESADQLS
jgi:hypothetical protein